MKEDRPGWWRGIHLVALAALAARLALALAADQIYWPDEIHQTLEQAHRLTFGYGYVPWEFRFGARSWILAIFLSLPLLVCKWLGIDHPDVYIPAVKCLLILLSVFVVYSAYVAGRYLASEPAGRLAALFAALWYELIYFAPRAMPEALAAYLLLGSLACAVSPAGHRKPVLFGLLAAMVAVIRFQYLFAVGILALVALCRWHRIELRSAAVAGLAAVAAVGALDYWAWGGFLVSYYNNYLLNVVYGVSGLFGTAPAWYYATALMTTSAGLFGVVGVLGLTRLPRVWLPLARVAGIVVPHLFFAHKEYRFVLAAVPLLLLVAAILVADGIEEKRRAPQRRALYIASVSGLTAVSAVGLLHRLPAQASVYPEPLCHGQEMLDAYRLLAREPDLVAVYNSTPDWRWTGGYYYLHRDVPIYLPQHLGDSLGTAEDLARYASHLVCPATTEAIPGFESVARIGELEIRRQVDPPAHYLRLPVDTREMLHLGVDDRFKPTVRRRF